LAANLPFDIPPFVTPAAFIGFFPDPPDEIACRKWPAARDSGIK
jgi:hypothetical protein